MYVVLLRFSTNSGSAGEHMAGHKKWIQRGLDDGVFLLVGSIKPGPGGAILAHNTSLDELHKCVDEDPFVAHDVVAAEVIEIAPGMADERLAFLL
jgi:uncharacterized protein YciI